MEEERLELEERNNIQRSQPDYGYIYNLKLKELTCSSCGLVIGNDDIHAMLDHIESMTFGYPLNYNGDN